MISEILKIKNSSTFDFTTFANPNDEFKGLFPLWKDYYKLKHSIAKSLQPKTILELGVRYGYAAATFLSACPDAQYTAVTPETDKLNWAKKITKNYNITFTDAPPESQQIYDLIHINKQFDESLEKELEFAIQKAKYILVNGYLWTKNAMLSSTYFLEKYARLIEYGLLIPGYSGELLIKTKAQLDKKTDHRDLEDAYTQEYYLNDCGGFQNFLITKGESLEDPCKKALFLLVDAQKSDAILDVGSGRGELVHHLSKITPHCIGIDYSQDAITIAQNTFPQSKFIKTDILDFQPQNKFDKIIMGDVVEHIQKEDLAKIFQKISQDLLAPDGELIIHTAPNKNYYEIVYAKKVKHAKDLGIYLPENPRSYFEEIMHINEQTTVSLAKFLNKYFKHNVVWEASATNFVGSLDQDCPLPLNSIFAVVSNREIAQSEIRRRIEQKALNSDNLNIQIESEIKKLKLTSNEVTTIPLVITNNSNQRISSSRPHPINLSYHLRDRHKSMLTFDGERTPLTGQILPGERVHAKIAIRAPKRPGKHFIEISLVQEGKFWLEDHNQEISQLIECEVV